VDASLRHRDGHCLLVTSPAGPGLASRSAASLALSAAADGRTVVLVDADLNGRELSTLAGVAASAGLTELVDAGRDPGRHLRSGGRRDDGDGAGGEPRVALLPAGRPVPNPAAFYRRASFHAVLGSIARRADLVLVVAAPVLDQPDAGVLADVTDAVLLVVPESTTDTQLAETRARLSWSQGGLLGYVLLEQSGAAPWRHPFLVARNDDERALRRESKRSSLRGLLEPLQIVSGDGRPSGAGAAPFESWSHRTGASWPPVSEALRDGRSPT
jgi:hypothetical protein